MTKTCKDCSVSFTPGSNRQIRCSKCSEVHKQKKRKEYNQKHNPKNKDKYKGKYNERTKRILKKKGLKEEMKNIKLPKKTQKLISQMFSLEGDLEFTSEFIDLEKINLPLKPTAIQSVMGTGKTAYVEYFIRKAQKENLKVLYVCPNISTVQTTLEYLQNKGINAEHYRTATFISEVVISTLDSCDEWMDYDVLIVDEVLSLFAETTFKMNGVYDVRFDAKYRAIMSHKLPIILDRYVKPVLPLFDQKFFIVKNNFKKRKQINVIQSRVDRYLDLVIEKAKEGKEITFHSWGIRAIEKLEEKANDEHLRIKSIHSQTRTKVGDLEDAQIKCSTSKISRGVNLSGEIVFLNDEGRTHSFITALQMIDRARDSKEINIRITKDAKKSTSRYYSDIKSVDCYHHRLKLFDLRIIELEKHYRDVLLFLINDTYLEVNEYGLTDDEMIKVDNYLSMNLTKNNTKEVSLELSRTEIGKVISLEEIIRLINKWVIQNREHWIV